MSSQDSSISPTPRCARCGYELTGLAVEGRCPECAAPVWQPNQNHDPHMGLAIAALVCGILSIVGCAAAGPLAILPGIAGAITGEMAHARYKRDAIRTTGRGLAVAGRIMSWIGVAVGLGFLILIVALSLNP